MIPDTEWLSHDEAAAFLRDRGRRCTSAYLAKIRSLGTGPRFYRRNGQVAYKRADLEAYATPPVEGPFSKASDARPEAHAA